MKRFVKRNKLGKGRMLHVSAPLIRVRDPITGLGAWRVVKPGKTYRNAKRSALYNVKKLSDRERRIKEYRRETEMSPRQSRRVCKAVRRMLKEKLQ